MNDCGSGRWMRTCEPSLALFTVSGCQTDALVSDYSSKDKSSTGQKARWAAPPVEWRGRGNICGFPGGASRKERTFMVTTVTALRAFIQPSYRGGGDQTQSRPACPILLSADAEPNEEG